MAVHTYCTFFIGCSPSCFPRFSTWHTVKEKWRTQSVFHRVLRVPVLRYLLVPIHRSGDSAVYFTFILVYSQKRTCRPTQSPRKRRTRHMTRGVLWYEKKWWPGTSKKECVYSVHSISNFIRLGWCFGRVELTNGKNERLGCNLLLCYSFVYVQWQKRWLKPGCSYNRGSLCKRAIKTLYDLHLLECPFFELFPWYEATTLS